MKTLLKAAWGFAKLGLGGIWGFLLSLPWQIYAALVAAVFVWVAWTVAISQGDKRARAELAPLLAQAHAAAATSLQQAMDAEGRSEALAKGLNDCVGAKAKVEEDTALAILDRDKRRIAAERALTATRKELNDAYAKSADACAGQSVPDDVLRLLDNQTEADSDAKR